jgi:hypothetical protein
MQLLIKIRKNPGLAAHLPDTEGMPLCHLPLQRADWRIEDRTLPLPLICHTCQRIQAKIDRNR